MNLRTPPNPISRAYWWEAYNIVNQLCTLITTGTTAPVSWNDLTGVPLTFTPTPHTHTSYASYTHYHNNYVAVSATISWTSVTTTPTTLSGYGITDASSATHTHSAYETFLGVPVSDDMVLSSKVDGTRSWVVQASGGTSCFETDINGDYMPATTPIADTIFEVDGFGDIEPK